MLLLNGAVLGEWFGRPAAMVLPLSLILISAISLPAPAGRAMGLQPGLTGLAAFGDGSNATVASW